MFMSKSRTLMTSKLGYLQYSLVSEIHMMTSVVRAMLLTVLMSESSSLMTLELGYLVLVSESSTHDDVRAGLLTVLMSESRTLMTSELGYLQY